MFLKEIKLIAETQNKRLFLMKEDKNGWKPTKQKQDPFFHSTARTLAVLFEESRPQDYIKGRAYLSIPILPPNYLPNSI